MPVFRRASRTKLAEPSVPKAGMVPSPPPSAPSTPVKVSPTAQAKAPEKAAAQKAESAAAPLLASNDSINFKDTLSRMKQTESGVHAGGKEGNKGKSSKLKAQPDFARAPTSPGSARTKAAEDQAAASPEEVEKRRAVEAGQREAELKRQKEAERQAEEVKARAAQEKAEAEAAARRAVLARKTEAELVAMHLDNYIRCKQRGGHASSAAHSELPLPHRRCWRAGWTATHAYRSWRR